MKKLFLFALAAVPLCCSAAQTYDTNGLPVYQQLEKVVVVSRHGVRAPTQPQEKLDAWSDKTWPQWGVERGYLTPRGFSLIKETWELNKRIAPFVYSHCPKPSDVQIIADVDERTIKTAEALRDGLYPGCGYEVRLTKEGKSKLFSPLKAKVCKIEYPEELAQKLSDRAKDISKLYAKELAAVKKLTGHDFSGPMIGEAKKHKVGYSGGPYDASSITEIMALEWGQFPGEKVGWGTLDWSGIMQMMPLRIAVFSDLNRDMEVARYKGSALAQKVMQSLDNGPKYTYLVGHDTNLANLGALFDLEWQLPGRARNENTPGGYLKFEKWLVGDKEEIRISYNALSPEQIHADKVTEPVVEYQILPEGVNFKDWKAKYSRHLASKCIADD